MTWEVLLFIGSLVFEIVVIVSIWRDQKIKRELQQVFESDRKADHNEDNDE